MGPYWSINQFIKSLKFNGCPWKSVSNKHIGGCLRPSIWIDTIFRNFMIDLLWAMIFKCSFYRCKNNFASCPGLQMNLQEYWHENSVSNKHTGGCLRLSTWAATIFTNFLIVRLVVTILIMFVPSMWKSFTCGPRPQIYFIPGAGLNILIDLRYAHARF
jgi:hypothetical protein